MTRPLAERRAYCDGAEAMAESLIKAFAALGRTITANEVREVLPGVLDALHATTGADQIDDAEARRRPLVHDYVSTACHHDEHDRCRLVCKFCETGCGCGCHRRAADADLPTLASLAGSMPNLREQLAEPTGESAPVVARPGAGVLSFRGDPVGAVQGGCLCFEGTRIPVDVVLLYIGDDEDAELDADILADYPSLTQLDLNAARWFAAKWQVRRRLDRS